MLMNTKNRRNSKKQITGMGRKLSRKSRFNMVGGTIINVENYHTKEKITIDVFDNDPIEHVKEVVSNIINIRTQFLRLIFKQQQLVNDRTLADYNIHPNDTIIVFIHRKNCPKCHLDEQLSILGKDFPLIERKLRDQFNLDIQSYPMCDKHSNRDVAGRFPNEDDRFIMRKFDILNKLNTEETP
jgi:hypothetical protein